MAKIGSITVFTEQGAIEAYQRFYRKAVNSVRMEAEVVCQKARADLLSAYPHLVDRLDAIELEAAQRA